MARGPETMLQARLPSGMRTSDKSLECGRNMVRASEQTCAAQARRNSQQTIGFQEHVISQQAAQHQAPKEQPQDTGACAAVAGAHRHEALW